MSLSTFPPFWWTKNIRYALYLIRELTGPLIVGYFIIFLILMTGESLSIWDSEIGEAVAPFLFCTLYGFTIVGFFASLIHSVTWFWATTKASPIPLSKPFQFFLFFSSIFAWIIFSLFVIRALHLYIPLASH